MSVKLSPDGSKLESEVAVKVVDELQKSEIPKLTDDSKPSAAKKKRA